MGKRSGFMRVKGVAGGGQPGQMLQAECEVSRPAELFDLFGFSGSDGGGHNIRTGQHPRDGHVDGFGIQFLSNGETVHVA